jgi:hypothetical protein
MKTDTHSALWQPTNITVMTVSDDFEASLVERIEGWIGRSLRPEDGISAGRLAEAAKRTGAVVPPELVATYRRAGAITALMSGFEQFRSPEDWELADGRLVFLEENQGVCSWSVDTEGHVWQLTHSDAVSEQIDIGEFLQVVLPYQLAQGGWPYVSQGIVSTSELHSELEAIATQLGWPLLVKHNGLLMYGADRHLLWALEPAQDEEDASIFLSSAVEDEFLRLTEELDLAEL